MRQSVLVHLLPQLVRRKTCAATVVVIDVLRATTTIVEALSAGAIAVIPCGEIEKGAAVCRPARPRSPARRRTRRATHRRL